jgi:hypothetical protein
MCIGSNGNRATVLNDANDACIVQEADIRGKPQRWLNRASGATCGGGCACESAEVSRGPLLIAEVNRCSKCDVPERVTRTNVLASLGSTNGVSLSLEFRPYIELVTCAREFVADFYEELLDDADAVSRLALATHELLENVIKYSSDGRSQFAIDVFENGGERIVRIRARNRTTPERARELAQLVEEIASTPDAFQMYQQFMRRSAARDDGGSGLGLARIRAEAEMSLRCDVAGDEVTIVVEGPVVLARKQ